jgi:polar amino acid transport system substrate-binding protein
MKILKKLNLQTVLILVIVIAMIEFLAVSFISFRALRSIRMDQSQTLLILIGINLSMAVLFVLIMLLVLKAFRKINYYAFTSSVTGLPNKNFVLNNLIDEISHIGTFSALMSLDMDNFKAVNDSLGHLAGDQLLKHAGRRFRKTLDLEDCVCHTGGDEFLFFIKSAQNKKDIEKLAAIIINIFKSPFHIAGKTVDYVTASLGIALIPKDGHDFQTLYNYADDAMYAAKNAGKNQYFFYDDNISLHIYEDAIRKKELEDGIAKKEFRVFYQPQMASDGTLTGAEALVRWFKSDGRILPPAEFIGFAEKNGLILALSDLVIENVCRKVLDWAEKGYMGFSVAINLTAEHLIHDDICRNLLAKIKACNAPPQMIEFEITESMIISDFETGTKNINMIKDAGIKVSLDDFGTGYSSLNYLKKLPIDNIKIDKSFIDSVPDDQRDLALLNSIMEIAHNLGCKVVAEGVEKKEQFEALRNIHCDMFQGYYFGKPVDEDTFEKYFLKHSA